MTGKTAIRAALAATILLGVSACSDSFNQQIGISKQPPPDEFRVVTRAPLSLPPDYNLRPPQPGLPRPQEGTSNQQARQTVFRQEQPQNASATLDERIPPDGRSFGERQMLALAGADDSDPNIRLLVNAETNQINEQNEYLLDALVFWRNPEEHGVVVDPQKEVQRLRANAALGLPPTEGETPTIERRRKGLLEGIF